MKRNRASQDGRLAGTQPRCRPKPSKRILVVDDDVFLRENNAEVLTRCGYQTETAEDGAAAWEALQAHGYDLLITDNNMPNVSGVELVNKVRSAHMTLPVILASGAMPAEELDRQPWLHLAATLSKPFTGAELLGTVEKVLRPAVSAREEIPALSF
ncbi:MAG TPA: response regulator [Candidatus Acidoferrum sp.]|nr:response regulator [Candidatus Acidoferrum sp.]